MKPSEAWVIGLNWKLIKSRLRKYPWKVFSQYFSVQYFSFNILIWGLIFGFPQMFRFGIYYSLGSLPLALYTSYIFTLPIFKLYLKTLRISDKKNNPDLEYLDEDITREQIGEFSDLEFGLNRIQKKLKKRKDQIMREREEMQAFMSSVQEGLISVSLEEKVLFFNSQFATLFLDSEQMQLPSLSLTDIFRTPEVYEAFKKVLVSGITEKITCVMQTRLDHFSRHFMISLTPLRKTKSLEIYGVIGIFHDISDIKKTEQIRIDFVGNASHELRTPLTSIKGYLETLREDFKVGRLAQVETFLDVVTRNVDRLIELVNDLLSLSTLESHGELSLELINPLQLSDIVVSDLMILAKEKNQMIYIKVEADNFYADSRKVEQVLRNLVTNAIKYIPNDKTINIVWENADNGETLLKVIDNGPGIPPEHHHRLFERFYRIDKGRSRDQGGTGLGLAIVKHIMQVHGGNIQVKSTLGQGAEFICKFPNLER